MVVVVAAAMVVVVAAAMVVVVAAAMVVVVVVIFKPWRRLYFLPTAIVHLLVYVCYLIRYYEKKAGYY